MKASDPAPEPLRRPTPPPTEAPIRLPADRSGSAPEEERLRYVSRPPERGRAVGRQNLVWGSLTFLLGLLLLGYALYLAGPAAMFIVSVSLATAALLYVLARTRLFRQRNGGFLAAALVFLLAVGAVLVQQGWRILSERMKRTADAPATVAQTAPETPPAPSAAPSTGSVKPGETPQARVVENPSVAQKAGSAAPALKDKFPPSFADLERQLARVTRDFEVTLQGNDYYIHAGDIFPIAGTADGQVRLIAGDKQVSIPASAVEFSIPPEAQANEGNKDAAPQQTSAAPPLKREAARITDRAQREARSRYPALGVKGSPENRSFVEAYQELKYSGSADFFSDPEWPLRLAEMLAGREGWRKNGEPEPTETPLPSETTSPSDEATGSPAANSQPLTPQADATELPPQVAPAPANMPRASRETDSATEPPLPRTLNPQ